MNKVTIYRYDENKPMRTLNLNGEPWFVLRDVCEVLGLGNSRMVADRLDEDEKGVSQIDTLGGVQNATIISESGLYNGSSAPASSLRPTRTSGSAMSAGSSSKTSCFTSAWRTTNGRWLSSLSRKTATPTARAHGWPVFRSGATGDTLIA